MEDAIRIEYDSARDVYFLYPCWHVATEDDCKAWYAELERFFVPLGRKVDCVLIADMFSLDAAVAETWNMYRMRLHATYMRFAVRVYLSAEALMLHGRAHVECAVDVETAVGMILEKRRGA